MDVYLSARFGRRHELREFAQQLEAAGVHVTSRWIHVEDELDLDPVEAVYRDRADLSRAQVLVAFTEGPDVDEGGVARGGRHVEWGIALASGRYRLIVVGPRENVFHHVDDAQQFDTAAAALERLIADAEVQRRAGW